ncbi:MULTISPECIES: hypothetical protein [unclassified Clostridium]
MEDKESIIKDELSLDSQETMSRCNGTGADCGKIDIRCENVNIYISCYR